MSTGVNGVCTQAICITGSAVSPFNSTAVCVWIRHAIRKYKVPCSSYVHLNAHVIVFIKNQLLPHFKCGYLIRGVFIVNVWVTLEVLAFHEISDVVSIFLHRAHGEVVAEFRAGMVRGLG